MSTPSTRRRLLARFGAAFVVAATVAVGGGLAATASATPASDTAPAQRAAAPVEATVIGDDYPYKFDSPNEADPWLFYKRECVSFAAWRVRNTYGIDFNNYYGGVHWGNANGWDDAARALGMAVDQSPAPGTVAQWNSGDFGHVAWVAEVNGDGTVTLEEYNRNWDHNYSTRVVAATDVENYIHF